MNSMKMQNRPHQITMHQFTSTWITEYRQCGKVSMNEEKENQINAQPLTGSEFVNQSHGHELTWNKRSQYLIMVMAPHS